MKKIIIISFPQNINEENNIYFVPTKYYFKKITIISFTRNKLCCCRCYRFLHRKCLLNGSVVPTETVREIVLVLDPQGVAVRRMRRFTRRRYNGKGPNFCSIDSYDKLKPFGLGVLCRCIDGFSRLAGSE